MKQYIQSIFVLFIALTASCQAREAKSLDFKTLQLYFSSDNGKTWQMSSKISKINSQWFTVRHAFQSHTNFIYKVDDNNLKKKYVNKIVREDKKYDIVELEFGFYPKKIYGICEFQGQQYYDIKVKIYKIKNPISAIVSSIYGNFKDETKMLIRASCEKYGLYYPALVLKDLISSNDCGTLAVFKKNSDMICFGIVNAVYQNKTIFCLVPQHWLNNGISNKFWFRYIEPIMTHN